MQHGWLTTLRADGSPRTSRVWFIHKADQIWIATSESARKVSDIRRDQRVSFAIEGQHGAVTRNATLVVIESRSGILGLFRDNYDGWDPADPTEDGPRVFIRLTR